MKAHLNTLHSRLYSVRLNDYNLNQINLRTNCILILPLITIKNYLRNCPQKIA